MTLRQRIQRKPGPVVQVIQMIMTKASLDDKRLLVDDQRTDVLDEYLDKALAEWEQWLANFRKLGDTRAEADIAAQIVEMMRGESEVWGKILREGTN